MNDALGSHWLSVHSLMVVSGLVIYGITSHARKKHRHPSAAMAWLVSLVLIPYLALPLYLLLGNRKIIRDVSAAKRLPGLGFTPDLPPPTAPAAQSTRRRFQDLAAAMGLPAPGSYQALHIHQDGEQALASLIQMLERAEQSLDICTFFLGRDPVGRHISEILIRRAQAGVRVRLLLDGVGIYLGGKPDLKPLKAAGIQVALFFPPFRVPPTGGTNLRNHRKLVIADQACLWTGGRNLAAEYFCGDPDSIRNKGRWIDLSFDLSGPLVHDAQRLFEQDWELANRGSRHPSVPVTAVSLPAVPVTSFNAGPHPAQSQPPEAQVIASGPDQADDTLYSLLISSCFSAHQRILMVTPYFVPDATLLMAMTLAARRGVRVDLLMPAHSNHRLADMARHASLRDMVLAGTQVWLCPQMIHAKAVVVDDDLALAGSANLDERSMFLNFEVMIAFFESADVNRFAQWLQHQRANAVPYQARKPGVLREFGEGLLRWLAFQL